MQEAIVKKQEVNGWLLVSCSTPSQLCHPFSTAGIVPSASSANNDEHRRQEGVFLLGEGGQGRAEGVRDGSPVHPHEQREAKHSSKRSPATSLASNDDFVSA